MPVAQRGRIWGAAMRSRYQVGRLGRLLERLGLHEHHLAPGCGRERVAVTVYLTRDEDVTLERMTRFYGLAKAQLGRGCLVALLGEHHERMRQAEELGYGR